MISPAKIYSVLGNPKSLVPIAVKDASNCLGMTGASYVTGKKEEAQDRFIDEVGTAVLWIGGIPLFKKLLDKTLFKIAKFDPKYDIRNLENKEIFNKTIKKAPTKEIANDILKIGKNANLFKKLNFVKVVAATVLSLGAYNVLTDMKQKFTDKKLEIKIKQEMEKEQEQSFQKNKSVIYKSANGEFKALSSLKNNKNVNFKGGLTNFMLDPVKNMYVLDGGITSQRLAKSRDPQEFAGYAIKEGGFLFFLYYAGQKVQDFFTNRADKVHNKSINLDSRVLEDEKLKEMFKSGEIENSINEFPEYSVKPEPEKTFIQKVKDLFNPSQKSAEKLTQDAKLYDYIHNNPDNAVIKTAKKSDIIENYKVRQKGILGFFKKSIDTGKIDTRKYIDLDSVRETHKDIKKLYNQYKASGEDVDKFFDGVRKLKRNSVKVNMLTSMTALAVILPAIMLAKRVLSNDTEFATKKRIREKLENEQKSPKV